MTRREFLAGGFAALGFGAFPRIFAAPPGWTPPKRPRLVFGVVSDTHLRTAWNGRSVDKKYTDAFFKAALAYFRAQDVDAVMHCGDIANNGQIEAVRFHADAWNKAFPEGKGRDGRKVERLFVTGNHDVEGFGYTKFIPQLLPDPEERKRHLFATDMAGNWERIWGEKYEEAWHKVVNGYHFFGQHYPAGAFDAKKTRARVDECRAAGAFASAPRPVFFVTHRRPHLTAMARGAGPVAGMFGFYGHAHKSAANWNVIGYDAKRGFPFVQCPACHSSRGEAFLGMDAYIARAPLAAGGIQGFKSRQGYVVRVYDDMLAIERREFDGAGASLGANWLMPFDAAPHPFSKASLKKAIGQPQFRKGAKLEVENVANVEILPNANIQSQLETGNIGIGNTGNIGNIVVKIPLADGNADSRVYAYEVVAIGEEGSDKLFKALYATGCNAGIGRAPDDGVTMLEIPQAELPPGKTLTIAARPLSSLGTSGKAIATEFKL